MIFNRKNVYYNHLAQKLNDPQNQIKNMPVDFLNFL